MLPSDAANPDEQHSRHHCDAISNQIITAAQFAKVGMAKYVVPTVTKGIEAVGDIVINHTEPLAKSNPQKPNDKIHNNEKDLKYFVRISDQSVKTSDSIRRGARSVAFGVRDFSTRQVQSATTIWKEKELGKQMILDEDVLETIMATGKVGAATLGAAALLTETMFETTKAIAQTSVKVASDVANHKYGEDAGKLVQNTGDATGNVLRTITHVKMLKYQVLAQVIAKNTAKEEVAGKTCFDDDETDPVLTLTGIAKNKLVTSNVESDQENTCNTRINTSQRLVRPYVEGVDDDETDPVVTLTDIVKNKLVNSNVESDQEATCHTRINTSQCLVHPHDVEVEINTPRR